jgi:UDP-4-amino-4,6-dideoxy-N-acetyl-beta-L-altrosamine N-acetyltransferase
MWVRKVELSDIEIIRNWRNAPQVRNNMEFSKFITKQMQIQWYQSIKEDSTKEYYIFGDVEPIGVVHLYNIDLLLKNADVGLFIGDTFYFGSGIGIFASKFILNRAFIDLELNKVIAKVKKENSESIQYNSFLGFSFMGMDSKDFQLFFLTKESYINILPKLNKLS